MNDTELVTQPKVFGPYDLTASFGQVPRPFLVMKFSRFDTCQIMVSVQDNVPQALPSVLNPTNGAYLMVSAEISVWGAVVGYETLIKRQFVKSNWGPLQFKLRDDEIYDQIILKGRLNVGGKYGIPNDIILSQPLVVNASVNVLPRKAA